MEANKTVTPKAGATLVLPGIVDTRRTAVLSAQTGRHTGKPFAVSIPDRIEDVASWAARVYGQVDLIEVRDAAGAA